ncbi:peptidoglycan DD-metalloendopeptidase family protein [Flavobacterium agricola]|uniref:Peptidoglycan DD-metalloendopeptidase family protein n=1 Tax=Flavobacterium agricola TaxID=2870839 RepID=A0ABY6M0Z3_9FLAO|nr:peptidoglycan DD-metalloendopeptidase family protein [Flavobacterium agricola]UYW00883.1 peptidoglycan DD-metalloendopeptidase family protein [Flavobacterium agricola]
MYKLFFSLAFISLTHIAWGQQTSAQQQQLEKRKAQLLNEIRIANSKLNIEASKEKDVLADLKASEEKIAIIEDLITTAERETKFLDDNIYNTQKQINVLTAELNALKEDYKNTIVKSYKSRNEKSRIMFVLSSENFLQAYKRIQYMKYYASYRKIQGDEIQEKNEQVKAQKIELELQRAKKIAIIEANEKNKQLLSEEKKKNEKLVAEIKKNKRKYTAEITKKQQQSKQIQKEIDELVRKAIAEANRKKAEEARRKAAAANSSSKSKTNTTTASSAKVVLDKEGEIISNNFKNNKGKLPWPVENGYVSSKFGIQPHPVYSNLTIDNGGVEIKVENGSNARAVFDGEVIQIQVLGNTKAILVQHGEYFTLYKNLSTVSVKVGDKVTAKQDLGRIHIPSNGRTVLNFYVYKNTEKMNPSHWVKNL